MKWWSTEDITVEWLAEIVGAPVVGFTTESITSRPWDVAVRVHMQTRCGPSSVIVKAADPAWTGTDDPLRREHLFYSRPAVLAASPVETCLDTTFDPASGRFWVVLEDLGPGVMGDDLVGVSWTTALLAVTALADVHATFQSPSARGHTDWIPPIRTIERDELGGKYVQFVERYGERIPQRHTAIANRIVASVDALNAHAGTSAAPRGVINADFRFDNLVLGMPGSNRPVTITRWHRVCWGPAATDLAMFLGTALDRETRRAMGDDLLIAYFDALGESAPESVEALRRDVRDRAYTGLINAILSSVVTPPTAREMRLWLTMFSRACDYLDDLDTHRPPRRRGRALRPAAPDDEFPHPPEPGQPWNEAWYFDVADVAAGIGAYVRFGVAPGHATGFYSGAVSGPGIPTISLHDTGVTPSDHLTVDTGRIIASHEIVTPLQQVRVSLTGSAQVLPHPEDPVDTDVGDITVRMDLQWYTSGTAHRYELASLYEIPCAVTGTITLIGDGLPEDPITIDAPGQRNHSWGLHNWWDIEWFWLAAHFEDNTRMQGLDVRVAGLPPMSMGYSQHPDTSVGELDKCRLIDLDGVGGQPQTATFAVEPGSTTVAFRAQGHAPQLKVDDAGRVSRIPRAWGIVTRGDGRQGVGWVECNRQSPNL